MVICLYIVKITYYIEYLDIPSTFFLYLTHGYGSIPINTIFRGMNIHLPAIFDVHQGDRVLTHPHMPGFDLPEHLFDAYLSEGRPRAGDL